jgi:hypothetical protein
VENISITPKGAKQTEREGEPDTLRFKAHNLSSKRSSSDPSKSLASSANSVQTLVY